MTPTFELIESVPDLEALCKRLGHEEVVAVDIEADSLHHYAPKICLVQISTVDDTFIVDPLATGTISPLCLVFEDPKITKVFHGGDYDLRSLYRDFATTVCNVFDTMVASQFLGITEVGLAAVLKTRFGLTLNKKYQKANWAKRPLTKDMLLYAARDTDHLIRLYREVARELELKGRLDWVVEECKSLSVACSKPNNTGWACGSGTGQTRKNTTKTAPLFKRFKGAGTMSARNLAVLERLLAFREKMAKKQDRPSFKLFGNKLIKELVMAKPTNRSAIEALPELPKDFMGRYAKGVLAAIKNGLGVPEHRLPVYPKTRRPPRNPQKQARLKKLKTWRDNKAKEFSIGPGVLCNNALLDAVAEYNPIDVNGLKTVQGISRWQTNVLGQEIIRILGQ